MAFSPDGQTLASGGLDNIVRIWDVRTGKVLHRLTEHQHWVNSVAFSPDGQTLASGAMDNTVYLWDVRTGRVRDTFNYGDWVDSVAFSPDGKMLAIGGSYGSIRLWDVLTGVVRDTFNLGIWVHSVAFSPDGNTLAGLSPEDGNIRLWDVDTGVSRHTFNEFTAGVINKILFSPDGWTLASQEENVIRLWDVRTNTVRHTLTGIVERASCAFSPDSQTIACGVWNERSVYLWDVDTGELQRGIPVADHEFVTDLAFSPDGQTLVGVVQSTSYLRGAIRLWDVPTGRVQSDSSVVDLPGGEVFSPDIRILAGKSDDRIHLYDVHTGEILHTLTGHQESISDLAFSPDGKILASACYDTTVRLWDVRTGRQLHVLIGHSLDSKNVAFHPNGNILASGLSPVYLWDVRTGQYRKTLKMPRAIFDMAFSPDGQILAGATVEGKIHFWEASSDLLLPVSLSSFRAEKTLAGILLKWTTESELDNAGFNILRSRTQTGEFKQINTKLIKGAGTTGERNTYTWTDTTATPNTVYYYRIEDVSHAGARQQLATVRLKGLVSAKDKLITQWSQLKSK